MGILRWLIMSAAVLVFSGCSTETMKRAGYETLQNVKQQRCAREASPDECGDRESYDSYQDKLKENKPPKKETLGNNPGLPQ